MRIPWQGFVDPAQQRPYVERLVGYLNQIADPGFEYSFSGVSPPNRYLHRMTELRCSPGAGRGAGSRARSRRTRVFAVDTRSAPRVQELVCVAQGRSAGCGSVEELPPPDGLAACG